MPEKAMIDSKPRDLPDPLENRNQVAEYVREHLGYGVSVQTVYNHIAKADGLRPAKGGWPKRTVAQYAEQFFGHKRRSDAAPSGALPLWSGAADTDLEKESASLERIKNDSEYKRVQVERERWKLDKDRAKSVPVWIIGLELGARAKLFRLMLETFAHEQARAVCSLMGGDEHEAAALLRACGADESLAPRLAEAVNARQAELVQVWKRKIEDHLHSFVTTNWFTDEMRAKWEAWRESATVEDFLELFEVLDSEEWFGDMLRRAEEQRRAAS